MCGPVSGSSAGEPLERLFCNINIGAGLLEKAGHFFHSNNGRVVCHRVDFLESAESAGYLYDAGLPFQGSFANVISAHMENDFFKLRLLGSRDHRYPGSQHDGPDDEDRRQPYARFHEETSFFPKKLFFKQGQVLSVALCFQILYRDKSQGGRIDAVPQSGRFGPVIEHVPQVRVCMFAADFGADHEKA